MTNKLRLLIALAVFLPSTTYATDTSTLMFAASLNAMNALESRCEKLIPGYSQRYRIAYERVKNNSFSAMGITQEVLAEAASIREFDTVEIVSKFDERDAKRQIVHCEIFLKELNYVINN